MCTMCGGLVEDESLMCPACNAKIAKDSTFCNKCGYNIPKKNHKNFSNSETKKVIIILSLVFFIIAVTIVIIYFAWYNSATQTTKRLAEGDRDTLERYQQELEEREKNLITEYYY